MSLDLNKTIGSITPTFTPSYFKNAYNNYKRGSLRQLIAMFEYCEIDSHVAGCLLGRNAGYKKEWKVSPATESAQDSAIAEFIAQFLSTLNMREFFEEIMEAKYKKFVVFEFEDWEIIDNKQVPKLNKLHQKYFRFDRNDNDRLKIDKGRKLIDIPEDSAFVVTYRKNPLLLPVLRDYILKEFGVESWAAFMETFGEPFVIGKYPPGSDPEFRRQLEDAVNAIGASSRGTAPEGSNIEIHESKRNTGDHEKFVDRCDRGISISLLGHENAVKQGSSLQVGENLEAYKVKRDVALDDIYFIQEKLNRFIRMLVMRNFSAVTKFPIFEIDKSEPIKTDERLRVLDQAYEQGVAIDPREYELLGIKIQKDQKILQKPDFLD